MTSSRSQCSSRAIFETLAEDRISDIVEGHGAGKGAFLVEEARGEAMADATAIVVVAAV